MPEAGLSRLCRLAGIDDMQLSSTHLRALLCSDFCIVSTQYGLDRRAQLVTVCFYNHLLHLLPCVIFYPLKHLHKNWTLVGKVNAVNTA